MIIYEFKESAYNKAFDLLEEIKDHGKKVKMAVCALEDALYDCYESEEDYEDESEELESNFRDREMYRKNMRMRRRNGMRRRRY